MIPPPLPDPSQRDKEQLNLLGIFHFVFGGLSLLGLGFLFAHYTMMRFFFQTAGSSHGTSPHAAPPMPPQFMNMMIVFYIVGGLIMIVVAALNIYAGTCLRRQTNRTFTFIIAGLNCLSVPLGTVLGIFTIIALQRESVMRLYRQY